MALLGFRHLVTSAPKARGRSGGGGGKSSGNAGGFTDSQMVSLLSATLGKNPSVAEMTAVQQNLALIQGKAAPEAQVKIVQLEAAKRDLTNKNNALMGSISKTESNVQNSLNAVAKDSFSNPYQLSQGYAEQYSLAVENIQQQMDDLISSGDAQKADIEALNKKKSEYMDKVKFYGDLSASYYTKNSTGSVGPENPSEYSYVPQVNPATGKISSVEIVKTADLGKDYMITDIPIKTLNGQGVPMQMAIPTHEVGKTPDGKSIMGGSLGRLTFEQKFEPNKAGTGFNVSPNITAKEGDEGNIIGNIFGAPKDAQGNPISEVNATIRDARANGLDLGDSNHFGFDSTDPGNGTLIMAGSKMFYKDEQGNSQEISADTATLGDNPTFSDVMKSKQTVLTNYLKAMGKDPQTISNTLERKHFAAPDFAATVNPTNKISSTSFGVDHPFTPAAQTAQPQQNWVDKSATGLVNAGAKFFSGREPAPPPKPSPFLGEAALNQSYPTKPNKPDVAKESSGGFGSVGDILAKGAAFFGSKK